MENYQDERKRREEIGRAQIRGGMAIFAMAISSTSITGRTKRDINRLQKRLEQTQDSGKRKHLLDELGDRWQTLEDYARNPTLRLECRAQSQNYYQMARGIN